MARPNESKIKYYEAQLARLKGEDKQGRTAYTRAVAAPGVPRDPETGRYLPRARSVAEVPLPPRIPGALDRAKAKQRDVWWQVFSLPRRDDTTALVLGMHGRELLGEEKQALILAFPFAVGSWISTISEPNNVAAVTKRLRAKIEVVEGGHSMLASQLAKLTGEELFTYWLAPASAAEGHGGISLSSALSRVERAIAYAHSEISEDGFVRFLNGLPEYKVYLEVPDLEGLPLIDSGGFCPPQRVLVLNKESNSRQEAAPALDTPKSESKRYDSGLGKYF